MMKGASYILVEATVSLQVKVARHESSSLNSSSKRSSSGLEVPTSFVLWRVMVDFVLQSLAYTIRRQSNCLASRGITTPFTCRLLSSTLQITAVHAVPKRSNY